MSATKTRCNRTSTPPRNEIHDILRDMVSKEEVEVTPAQRAKGIRSTRFTLSLKGWAEYLQALGSIYELPE